MATDIDRKVKGILFDFDNTLVSNTSADNYAIDKTIEVLSQHHSREEAQRMAFQFRKLISIEPVDPNRGTKTNPHVWRTGLWERILTEALSTKQEPSPFELYKIWKESRQEKLVIENKLISLLQELKSSYRLGIVTNGDSIIQREKLRKSGAVSLFETIVISGEQPQPKPDPSIFQTTCALLNVPPANCVMVGDNLATDVQGGLNTGVLATVWVNYNARKLKSTDPQPHYTINCVSELPQILEKLQS